MVDVAQYEAVHQILGGTMVQYFNQGVVRERTGNKSPTFQPFDAFRAADGWIVLGALGPIFGRVCRVFELDAEKCVEAATNVTSGSGLQFDAHLRGWIATRSVAEVVRAFNEARIPCSPVMTSADMAADPHYQARGVHTEWEDLQVGRVKGGTRAQVLADAGHGLAWLRRGWARQRARLSRAARIERGRACRLARAACDLTAWSYG